MQSGEVPLVPRRRVSREKLVRDVVRLEIAALLSFAREGKNCFMQDVLERVHPNERSWVKDELRKLEDMLRVKVEAHDEA